MTKDTTENELTLMVAVDELYRQLRAAEELIRKHCGMGMSKEIESQIWKVYKSEAPEMKGITRALNDYQNLSFQCALHSKIEYGPGTLPTI
jgi:hypothetical protein